MVKPANLRDGDYLASMRRFNLPRDWGVAAK